MSPVTTATSTPPVRVVCSRASPIITTVSVATTFVVLVASDQHDVVLPPHLIIREKMRGFVGLTTVLQQHQHQSQMPSQAM